VRIWRPSPAVFFKAGLFKVGFVVLACMLLAVVGRAAGEGAAIPDGPRSSGALIYEKSCAECHGKKGEGVHGKYDDILAGSRSLASLTRLISKTMPEGKEGTCIGADAEAVAAYIFDAFYSPAAQARIRPVQESLSRLTAVQYRNSVADLLGRFRPGFDRPLGTEHGLRGNYSGFAISTPEEEAEAKDTKKKDKKARRQENFNRVDHSLTFQFGTESPNPEKMIPGEFNVRWTGALYAPETGSYEFLVKTENGVRLWVNEADEPLIDSWVTPGPQVREERKSIFLLGGRTYRFALSFFKFKDKSASIDLFWKPPHGIVEHIPASHLMPQEIPVNMVVKTVLPADDRSDGYERGTTVSKEWEQAVTAAALEVVAHVEATLDNLTGSKSTAPDRVEKLKAFAHRFIEAAYRRPLSEEQKEMLVERMFQSAPTPAIAVKRVVLFALKSPRFLYPELANGDVVDDFAVASRLALVLWDSLPDAALTKAAAESRLHTQEQVEKEIWRMLGDARTKAKLNGFMQQWLDMERAEHASKDAKLFPEFDDALRADLRVSLQMFLDEVVWGEKSDYRELLQAEHLWLNARLGRVYGKAVEGDGFQRVVPEGGRRAGVLTHPYLLSALAYNRTTSPIHRGVFLSRSIVGINLKNPSVAVAFEDAKFDPSLTMREKVSSLTKNASCAGCHGVINPLGFTLENFDAVGRWRVEDNKKPVDAVVDFDAEEGHALHFSGVVDVANHAVRSAPAHESFVRQMFLETVKQPPAAFGGDTLSVLKTHFVSEGFHIRKLLAKIALTKAMRDLPKEEPKVAGP